MVVIPSQEVQDDERADVSNPNKENRFGMSRSLGIAVNLLHEASGHVVTVELKSLLRKHD
ncbi:hypothetical protein JHK87_031101 [Glycine soja]|nr:hypothetical protein JHK87_031101 [Glycine soja]